MASGTLQFFARRDEFLALLAPITEALELVVLTARETDGGVEWQVLHALTPEDIDRIGASRLFLAERDFDVAALTQESGVAGLVVVDLPREQDNVLLMGDISVKTDWLDRTTGKLLDHPERLKLYKRVRSRLRRSLLFPVRAENIVLGGTAVYRSIGYTPAAKAFTDQGGEWMQAGIKNVRFRAGPEPHH